MLLHTSSQVFALLECIYCCRHVAANYLVALKTFQGVTGSRKEQTTMYVYLHHTSDLLCTVQGLVMLEKATGKVVILASQVSDDSPKDPGSVINYANDLDIAQDGTVYFTTSCDIPVVPNALGFWDTFAVFTLTMLQVRLHSQV